MARLQLPAAMMSEVTVLVAPQELDSPSISIEGEAYHHLFRARRLRQGQILRLVDGRGAARSGRVRRVERDSAVVEPGDPVAANQAPRPLTLAVATLRRERASWLVEKGTELGVRRFVFFRAERAPRRFGAGTLDRLGRVARAALEQSHGSWLPEIGFVDHLSQAIEGAGEAAAPVLLQRGAPPLDEVCDRGRAALLAIIGPEGDFEPRERESLLRLGAVPAGLGSRVLRIETAAIAAASLLLAGRRDL